MLNPRERIKKLLQGKPIDKIPNGLGGFENGGSHVLIYDKIKEIFGIKNNKNRMYTFMANAVFEPQLLKAIDGDFVILGSMMCPAQLWGSGYDKDWKTVELWDKSIQVPKNWFFHNCKDGTIWWENFNYKCLPNSYYFNPVLTKRSSSLLFNWASGLENDKLNPDNYNPPHAIPDKVLRTLEKSAKWLHENTDLSIICGQMTTELQIRPCAQQDWWMKMVSEPEVVKAYLHKACEASISQLKQLDQAIGKYADLLAIADDIGDANGVTIGPNRWRNLYKPFYKRLFKGWHKSTRMKVLLHSCGSIYEILDDLIECGVDVINPVQISAHNMSPVELKNKYGKDIIFYGGAYDAIQTPPETPAEVVYENVKSNISILGKGGNYIFAGVHNMPANVPESHLKAIFSAYNDCKYLI